MGTEGSNPTNLTNNAAHDFDPSWSPDGSQIVFGRFVGTLQQIVVMSATGAGQTVITNDIGGARKADLSIEMAAAAQKQAKTVQYTIAVRNAGPSSAAGVTLTDVLPSAARYLAINTTQGTCSTPASGSSGTVSCALGSLAANRKVTVQITVKVIPPNSQPRNSASVSSTTVDPNSTNNAASVQTP